MNVLDGNDVLIYAAGVGTLKDHGISVEEALASDDEFFQMVASTELELGVDQLELGEDPVEQDQDDGPVEWLHDGVWYSSMVVTTEPVGAHTTHGRPPRAEGK